MSYKDKDPYKFFNDGDSEEVRLLCSALQFCATECDMEALFEELLDISLSECKCDVVINTGAIHLKVDTSIDYHGSGEYSSEESTTDIYIYDSSGKFLCEVYYCIGSAMCCESVLTVFEVILPEKEDTAKDEVVVMTHHQTVWKGVDCELTFTSEGISEWELQENKEEEKMADLSQRVPEVAKVGEGKTPLADALSIKLREENTCDSRTFAEMAKQMTPIKLEGEWKMTRNIRTINLSLTDNNENLSLEDTLVFSQGEVRTEHNDERTIQNILMSGKVQEALKKHNETREETVDKVVLRSTGNKVMLEPVEIWDLEWKVVQIA